MQGESDKSTVRHAGQKYRLYPTDEQAARMASAAGACRAIWNAALEQRRWAYRQGGVTLNSFSQNADLTELLHDPELSWVGRDASRASLKNSLRDLDVAYTRFFKGLGSFPQFKRRGVRDSFRTDPGRCGFRRVNRRWAEVRIPKIGWVRLRLHQPPRGQLKGATFYKDAVGWHVAFMVELVGAAPKKPEPSAVGLDRGVAATVATSRGEFFHSPKTSPGRQRRRRRLEQQLARQCNGSRRREATKQQLAKLRARESRQRNAFAHELTTQIARLHDFVAIEDLKVANMTRSAKGSIEEPGRGVRQKAGLNRVILEQGWGEIRRQLEYKRSWRGSTLVLVDPRHTSQTCSACGHVAAENRKSQAIFSCVDCGEVENADVNAARVILARGLDQEPGARTVLAARGGFDASRPVKREGEGLVSRSPALPASSAAISIAAVNINDHLTAVGS